jgi:hypothetical protein
VKARDRETDIHDRVLAVHTGIVKARDRETDIHDRALAVHTGIVKARDRETDVSARMRPQRISMSLIHVSPFAGFVVGHWRHQYGNLLVTASFS